MSFIASLFSPPKAPSAPKPPMSNDTSVQLAQANMRRRLSGRGKVAETLTSPTGVQTSAATQYKTLLGG